MKNGSYEITNGTFYHSVKFQRGLNNFVIRYESKCWGGKKHKSGLTGCWNDITLITVLESTK